MKETQSTEKQQAQAPQTTYNHQQHLQAPPPIEKQQPQAPQPTEKAQQSQVPQPTAK
ncbi:unnamed protein product, partial [Rotaria sp. Silwood2]